MRAMTAVGKVYLIKEQATGGTNSMQTYADMTKEQLQEELTKVRQIYKEYQDKGLAQIT